MNDKPFRVTVTRRNSKEVEFHRFDTIEQARAFKLDESLNDPFAQIFIDMGKL